MSGRPWCYLSALLMSGRHSKLALIGSFSILVSTSILVSIVILVYLLYFSPVSLMSGRPPTGVRSERATLILFSCFNDERATMILMSRRHPWLACVVCGQPRYFSFFIDERATPLIGERRELAGNLDIIQMFYWWAQNLDIGERATPP